MNTLVSFRSASPGFAGQFSVGVNTVTSGPVNVGHKEGVATIAFPTEAATDVVGAIGASLALAPRLDLVSGRAIDGTHALNKAVAEAKSALVHFRSRNQLEKVHLFIKAPSHFAMVLGHRLNAVGRVQLYDWVDGKYVATAVLA